MRYERKYRVENTSLPHILQIIKAHPASFAPLHPDRTVNNIYFDTPNMTCLNDNLNGVNIRKKYRVRWYGEQIEQIQNPKLEIKSKENELGTKKVLDIDNFDLSNIQSIQKQVSTIIKKPLQATLLNSYDRSYWASPDGKFRITIDSNLRFHSLLSNPKFWGYTHFDKAIIIELKYDAADEKELQRILQFLPFRLSKNSKYVQGLTLVN